MQLQRVGAQEGEDGSQALAVEADDSVVSGERVAVLPLWYNDEISAGENLSATVQQTIQLILRFLPNYELVDDDPYPKGQSGLTSYGSLHDLDTIIFGRIDHEGRSYTVSLLLYDISSDQIVEVKQESSSSMLEIFELTDRLSIELLESYIGRPLAFGALTFVPTSNSPERYRVYINGTLVGENTPGFDRFLAGNYTVKVDQVVSEYNVETVYEQKVIVEEGATTTVEFARIDVGECLVNVDGPDVPVTLRNSEAEILVKEGQRIVLAVGNYEFAVTQPDYRGEPYPLGNVVMDVEPGVGNAVTLETVELGRGFRVVPQRRGRIDTAGEDAFVGEASYFVYVDNSLVDSGHVEVLPLGIYRIDVEQTIDGSRVPVLSRRVENEPEEVTTVEFPLFASREQWKSYQRNREPDLSLVVQAFDGAYLQAGLRYEAIQRRVGLSLLGGFYSLQEALHATGKGKLHWISRGGGAPWTPEVGLAVVVDAGAGSPTVSFGPNLGISWSFGNQVLSSAFVENELRYTPGNDFLLVYFFGIGMRLF